MKFAVVLLALVALAAGYEFQEVLDVKERSVSSQIVDAIEAAKVQMPCGFPGLGVPPLAPLKFEHKELNLEGDTLDLSGIFEKFRLYGLDDFDIVELKVNLITSKMTFRFNWNHVNLRSKYEMLMKMHNSNLISKLDRLGGAKISVSDFIVWGSLKYSLGVVGGKGLRLKELKVYASVGDVKSEIENLSNIKIVNRKLNEIIEEWIMLAVNDNTENLAIITNDYVVPIVNEMIGDKSLSDLLGMISGGGGGEPGGEPQICIPPVIED